MIVGALVWDPTAKARLEDAAKGQAYVRCCHRQSELLALVANDLAQVAVIDVRDREGNPTLPTVRVLHLEYPSVPVILYCDKSAFTSRELMEFVRAGVTDVVVRDFDDGPTTLRTALRSAADHCSHQSLIQEIEPLVPQSVMPMIRFCLEEGRRPLTVSDVAGALNIHRKTLATRVTQAGLPAPSTLISWCRLLVVARMLEDPGRSAEQVALMLEFPSSAALRNMVKRYTGLRTGEVRQNGGARCVLHAFKRYLAKPPEQRFAS